MIKIAFCDDDPSVLKELSSLFDHYRAERSYELEYVSYQSPLELIAGFEKGLRWDVLLLDVMMPGQNGMELAKEIREYDNHVNIIFLTSSPEFAVQSYTVGAFFYQLKPIHEDSFYHVLDQVMKKCEQSYAQKIILKCKSGITAIVPEKIEYCEVIGHSLLLHMSNGAVLESVGKLNELEEKLSVFGGFLRVHRSFLVNMEYIQSISYRAVTLACLAEIPIPHGKYNEIKKKYLNYAFEKESVML